MQTFVFYRLLFMVELFTAEFLFMYRLRKRRFFALRFAACIVLGGTLAYFIPPVFNAFYMSLTFLLLFAATVPMMKFCCDENWKNIFFCGIAAYTIQYFSYCLANFVLAIIDGGVSPVFGMYFEGMLEFSKPDLKMLFISLVYVMIYFLAYTAMYALFVRRIKRGVKFKIKSMTIMLFIMVALIVEIFINLIAVYYSTDESFIVSLMNTVYESLCSIFLLYIQFGLVKADELEKELDFTRELLREKERQYKLSKDNIELINFKCHDLRHQIREIGEGKGLPAEAVEEIKDAISIYDASVHTDNEVLDIILTEKSLKCTRDSIALTCVADGRSLDFMEKSDIYSLFGNALDNAMEAVMQLETERRTVGVIVRSVGNMVSVNIYNPYAGEVETDADGLPMTTKDNGDFHGFGIKSIKRIAEKYNGICTTSTNNNTFVLNVLMSKKITE